MTTKSALAKLDERLGAFTFGEFLRVARESIELTQTEMAKKLKIARGTLCDIEKGRQLVTPILAKKIALMAGLSVELSVRACLQDQLRKAGLKHKVNLVA
jgi:DNA-binding XRE family transcriptional regulator